jgi:hypothetical protein
MPLATYLKKAASAFPAARSSNNTSFMTAQQRPISIPSVKEDSKPNFDDPDVIRISQWDAFLFTVRPASLCWSLETCVSNKLSICLEFTRHKAQGWNHDSPEAV